MSSEFSDISFRADEIIPIAMTIGIIIVFILLVITIGTVIHERTPVIEKIQQEEFEIMAFDNPTYRPTLYLKNLTTGKINERVNIPIKYCTKGAERLKIADKLILNVEYYHFNSSPEVSKYSIQTTGLTSKYCY